MAGSKRKRSEDSNVASLSSGAVDTAAITTSTATKANAVSVTNAVAPVRGLPESGRFWKPLQRARFSAANRPNAVPAAGKGVRSGAFSAQQAERAARRAAAAHGARLLAERTAERKARGAALAAKRARKAENEFRAASLQEITDPGKLKRMSKKQLRQVKRVRVRDDGARELVPAYS